MRSIITFSLIALLALPFMACPKPSQEVKIARAIAQSPIGLKAAKDIVAVLVKSGDLPADAATKVNTVCDHTEATIERIAADIKAGNYDLDKQREWDLLLTTAIEEAKAILPTIKRDVDPRFAEWLDVALYTAPLFKSLIAQIKPPPAPAQAIINKDAKREGNTDGLSIGPGEVSAIVAISTAAAIKLILTQKENDLGMLWTRYEAYKAEYHSNDPPGVAPTRDVTRKRKAR